MKQIYTTGFAPSRTATSHRTATSRLLLITLLLFTFFGGARAEEVEIGSAESTSTSYSLPINPYYNYSLTQQIFTAEEIGMAGTINSISFYYTHTAALSMAGVKMYMMNVDKEKFESTFDMVPISESNLVWEGTLGATSAGWITIDLDTPFAYDGTSNLLVCLYDPTSGYAGSSFKFRTTATTEHLGIAYYSDNYKPSLDDVLTYSGYKTNYQYRSNIKLDITPRTGPTCANPSTFVVSDITARSASFTWENTGAGSYTFEYKKVSDSEWTVVTGLAVNSHTLSSLAPATDYKVRVKAVCGTDLASSYKTANFTTPCGVISTYPWTENFDSYTGTSLGSTNNLPMCWNYINGTTYSSYAGYPVVNSGNSYSGNNHLYFYSSYPNSGSYTFTDLYAVLPEMEGLSGKMLTLYAKAYYDNSSFTVGMMTDPTDASTFVAIDTKTPSTTEYNKYFFILGEGNYVAIKMEPVNSNVRNRGIRIDDLMIDVAPTCLEPTDLQHTGSTTNTATLSWTNGSNDQTAWQICINGDENNLINANSNPFTIENLTASSVYTAKVRAYCSETDQSCWSKEIHFITACDVISNLPWNENFNAYTAASTNTATPAGYPNVELPVCWQFLNRSETSSTYPQAFLTSYSAYAVSGNCLFFKSSSTTPLYAILPEFTNNISDLMLTFTYRNESTTTSNGTLIVGYMTDPTDASTFASVLTCEQTSTKTEKEVLFADAPAGSYIAFKYQGGSSNDYYLAIDDVMVEPVLSCRKPSGLTTDATTTHTATLHWTNGAEGQDAWQIAYSTNADFNPDDVTPVNVTTNPATIEGLVHNTTYYAYVRANCGNSDYSAWCKTKVSFTTLVGNVTPTGLAVDASTITTSQVTASWNAVANNTLHQSYDIYWAPATVTGVPAEPAAPNLITGITATSQVITGLDPETAYKVWVRDNCGTDGYSDWSSALTFSTASNCQTPDGLTTSEISKNSAVISWNSYGQNGFNLRYSTDGETWETIENVANPYTLTGLMGNTIYQVEVQARCNTTEWSAAMSFPTACNTVTEFPWSEDFESYQATTYNYNSSNHDNDMTNNCWVNEHVSGTGTRLFQVSSSSSTTGNNTKKLVLPDMADGTMTKLTLPEMNIPTSVNHQFVLDVYRNASDPKYLEEGIRVFASTDGEIEGATEMAFISRNYTVSDNHLIPTEKATGWYTYELPIPFSGTCYIILRGESKYGSSTYMDNFIVKETPTCLKPSGLTFVSSTQTSATLSWTNGEEGQDAWQIACSDNPTFDPDGVTPVDVTSNPATITGLTPGTIYYAYVRANCGNGDFSDWSNACCMFATMCETITSFPWSEDFENYSTGNFSHPCWVNEHISGEGTYIFKISSSTNGTNSTKQLQLPDQKAGTLTKLVLPEMTLPGNNYQFVLDVYRSNSYTGKTTEGIRVFASTDGNIEGATELAFIPRVYSVSNSIIPAEEAAGWYTYELPIPMSGTCHIILRGESQYGTSTYMDNFTVKVIPTCPSPIGLELMDATDATAILSWTEKGTATSWQISLNGDEESLIMATENPYTLTGLTASTDYTVKVRAVGNDEYSEWSETLNFKTTAVAEVVGDSWSDNFEGATCGWELINGELTNAWSWGTATNNGGTHALYISNDGGTTNAYTNNSATMVYATKLLTFAETKYEFSYDWKANGESTYDFLRVALVPTTVTLTAGTSAPSGFNTTNLPSGWIALDGGNYLNKVTDWQNKRVAANVTAGNYYLVVAWRNDDTNGTNPPAAIDNVNITRVTCPADVEDLDVNNTTTGAILTWTAGEATQWQVAYSTNATFEGATEVIVSEATYTMTGLQPSTHYYAKVRAYCGGEDFGAWSTVVQFDSDYITIDLSIEDYSEDFDGITVASNYVPDARTLPVGWQYINTSTDSWCKVYPTIFRYFPYYNSEPNSLRLYSRYSDPQPQYAILPKMNNLAGKQITLHAQRGWDDNDNPNCSFKIGTMTNPEDASTFTMIAEEVMTQYYNYFGDFYYTIPTSTTDHYIAIMIDAATSSSGANNVFIDDISVYALPCMTPLDLEVTACNAKSATLSWREIGNAAEWVIDYNGTTVNVTENPYTLTGLTPETAYTVKVSPACDESTWSSEITFTTPALIDMILADNGTDNNSTIDYNDGEIGNVTLSGRTLWKDGYWNTLCLPFRVDDLSGTPLEGATVKELDDASSNLTDGTLTLNFTDATEMEAGTPYLVKWGTPADFVINSADDWDTFCNALLDNETYNRFSGKTVALGADITVTSMAGSSKHDFCGTFDGQGHTLTFNYGSAGTPANEEYIAPFSYVSTVTPTGGSEVPVTIKNLHVAGDIYTANVQAAGIVARKWGTLTIENCHVSLNIHSTYSGDAEHGGLVASNNNGQLTIRNCAFTGSLLGNTSTKCGGFVGWRGSGGVDIYNSLFDPAACTFSGTSSATLANNCTASCHDGCYYTTALGTADATQGTSATSMSNTDLLTALGSGWQEKNGKVVPVMSSDRITDPVFTNVTIDATMRDVDTADGTVTFKGSYDYLTFAAEDKSVLFLGEDNTLYWPESGASIGAFRAYFQLNDPSTLVRSFVLNFEDEETQGISAQPMFNVQCSMFNEEAWYTLNGVKLDKMPTRKGLYIKNGRKVVIK